MIPRAAQLSGGRRAGWNFGDQGSLIPAAPSPIFFDSGDSIPPAPKAGLRAHGTRGHDFTTARRRGEDGSARARGGWRHRDLRKSLAAVNDLTRSLGVIANEQSKQLTLTLTRFRNTAQRSIPYNGFDDPNLQATSATSRRSRIHSAGRAAAQRGDREGQQRRRHGRQAAERPGLITTCGA